MGKAFKAFFVRAIRGQSPGHLAAARVVLRWALGTLDEIRGQELPEAA